MLPFEKRICYFSVTFYTGGWYDVCSGKQLIDHKSLFILEYVQSYLHEKELALQKVAVLMYKGER